MWSVVYALESAACEELTVFLSKHCGGVKLVRASVWTDRWRERRSSGAHEQLNLCVGGREVAGQRWSAEAGGTATCTALDAGDECIINEALRGLAEARWMARWAWRRGQG